jgi:hypothetical protein
MICQSCRSTAMSFLRFPFVIDPRSVRCGHCGAQLLLSPKWSRIWWTSLIVGSVVVIISVILRRIIGWGLLTNVVGIIVLAAAFSRYFWRSAIYEVKPQEPQTAPDIELP